MRKDKQAGGFVRISFKQRIDRNALLPRQFFFFLRQCIHAPLDQRAAGIGKCIADIFPRDHIGHDGIVPVIHDFQFRDLVVNGRQTFHRACPVHRSVRIKYACAYGCLGYGDCTRACAFDAIHIENGIAKVDREKCTGCGACAAVCPNHVIEVVPEHKRKPVVLCQNKDKGAQTRKACTAGCIGCMKCAKACPREAITVENNVAYIDQEKCVGCQLCVKECPVGVIHVPAAM